jgi:hypothetical protein
MRSPEKKVLGGKQRGIVLTPYLVLLVVIAFGLLSWRLAVVTGQRDVLVVEAKAREERDALRELQNLKNRERTNEEYLAATKRAGNSRVRVEGPGIRPRETVESAGSGNDPVACFDRRKLNEELAGLYERHAERLTGIAKSGEGVAAAFRACQAWAVGLN